MQTRLLEREADLHVLQGTMRAATEGRGSAVLISGEAGIGKTTLVRAFAEDVGDVARVLIGGCDDLVTPRSLGPFRDMTRDAERLRAAFVAGADHDAVLTAILEELADDDRPSVMIVEDVHWGDDATLDAMRFLARRLDRISGVIVLTYRDDEVTNEHPLLRVLGAFTGTSVQRVRLKPLTIQAVTALNEEGRLDTDELFGATGGNPFYVTEALAAAHDMVPPTVKDAVQARLRGLSDETRGALEQLSVIPARVERELAEMLVSDHRPLDEAEHRGVILASSSHIWFRHELARRAIEETLGAGSRTALNRRVLELLLEIGAEPSRIVHHALEAQADELVAEYAPVAARDAAHVGAHREAIDHFTRALDLRHLLSLPRQAEMLQGSARSLYVLQRYREAADRGRDAISLWEKIEEPVQLAETLVTHAYAVYWMGDSPGRDDSAQRAIGLLEPAGPSATLALAYGAAAGVRMMGDDPGAIDWGLKARAVAEKLDREDLLCAALNYLGTARMGVGDPEGEALLVEALDIARSIPHGTGAFYASRLCANLVTKLLRFARVEEAEKYVEIGLNLGRDYDLQHVMYRLEVQRAAVDLFRGDWGRAEAKLRELLSWSGDEGLNESHVHALLVRILARRGEPKVGHHFERGWLLAERSGEVERVGAVTIAWLESCWLNGDIAEAIPYVESALTLCEQRNHHEIRGEILRYLGRGGQRVELFDGCPDRFRLGITGQWEEAAALWESLGNPYERALELLNSLEVDPILDALRTLDELGADPAAALARRRLRELGVRRVPRGPQSLTRSNPAGLTPRQRDVLAFLAQGLTNPEIANRLVVSPRTVDHHVSAIFTKLGVRSRRDAGRMAVELGIVETTNV